MKTALCGLETGFAKQLRQPCADMKTALCGLLNRCFGKEEGSDQENLPNLQIRGQKKNPRLGTEIATIGGGGISESSRNSGKKSDARARWGLLSTIGSFFASPLPVARSKYNLFSYVQQTPSFRSSSFLPFVLCLLLALPFSSLTKESHFPIVFFSFSASIKDKTEKYAEKVSRRKNCPKPRNL